LPTYFVGGAADQCRDNVDSASRVSAKLQQNSAHVDDSFEWSADGLK